MDDPHDDWSKNNLLRATQPTRKFPVLRKYKRDVLLKGDEGEQNSRNPYHKLDLVYFGERN